MSETMKQQFGLIQRPWGVYYLKNKTTGEQTSLKTRDQVEAQRLLQANNDSDLAQNWNSALRSAQDGQNGRLSLANSRKIGIKIRRWTHSKGDSAGLAGCLVLPR